MKRGKKPLAPETKHARNTFQPCRDGAKVSIAVPDAPPLMREGLSIGAQLVWHENLGRVMGNGIADTDSDMFANYCELEAALRESWAAGAAPPPTSAISECRKMAELMGLTGPKSRVLNPTAPVKNRFAMLRK